MTRIRSHELPGPASRLGHLVMPAHANQLGTLFGGEALRLMDEAAAIAALRFAGPPVVTVHADGVDFSSPVAVGEFLEAEARVTAVGHSSLTVEVELTAEDLDSGERRATTRGRFVFVALGSDGRPRPVVPQPQRCPDGRP